MGFLVGLGIGYVSLWPISLIWLSFGLDWSEGDSLAAAACFQWVWLLICAVLGAWVVTRFWGNGSSSESPE